MGSGFLLNFGNRNIGMRGGYRPPHHGRLISLTSIANKGTTRRYIYLLVDGCTRKNLKGFTLHYNRPGSPFQHTNDGREAVLTHNPAFLAWDIGVLKMLIIVYSWGDFSEAPYTNPFLVPPLACKTIVPIPLFYLLYGFFYCCLRWFAFRYSHHLGFLLFDADAPSKD